MRHRGKGGIHAALAQAVRERLPWRGGDPILVPEEDGDLWRQRAGGSAASGATAASAAPAALGSGAQQPRQERVAAEATGRAARRARARPSPRPS